jgi:hypothetical protein
MGCNHHRMALAAAVALKINHSIFRHTSIYLLLLLLLLLQQLNCPRQ